MTSLAWRRCQITKRVIKREILTSARQRHPRELSTGHSSPLLWWEFIPRLSKVVPVTLWNKMIKKREPFKSNRLHSPVKGARSQVTAWWSSRQPYLSGEHREPGSDAPATPRAQWDSLVEGWHLSHVPTNRLGAATFTITLWAGRAFI